MSWNQSGNKKPKTPELNKMLNDVKQRFSSLLAGGKPAGNEPGGEGGRKLLRWNYLLALLAVGLVVAFIALGLYQVPTDQRAVVVHLGDAQAVKPAGLHWRNPLIDRVVMVPDEASRNYRQSSDFLTEDNNLVNVAITVTYHVAKPSDYALVSASPLALMQNQLLAILRSELAQQSLSQLTKGSHDGLSSAMQKALGQQLAHWHSGIHVDQLDITQVGTVSELTASLASLKEAQSKVESERKTAKQDGESKLLSMQGQAQALLTKAKGYDQQVVDKANSEVSRFEVALTAYQKSPQTTRDRLYLSTLETVFANTTKVLLTDSGNNTLSLPLAAMMAKQSKNLLRKPVATDSDGAKTSGKQASAKSSANSAAAVVPSLYGGGEKEETK